MSNTYLDRLLPSFGHFGQAPKNSLAVPVKRKVKGVKLWLAADAPEILNLGGVQIEGNDGELLDLAQLGAEMRQSSVLKDDPAFGPESLGAGKGCHTNRELRPWWEVRFTNPTEVAMVRVLNRADKWARRSRFLVVGILQSDDPSEQPAVLYRNGTADACAATVSRLASCVTAGGQIALPLPTGDGADSLRRALKDNLASALISGSLKHDRVNWDDAIQLVDLYEGKLRDEADFPIVAHYIWRELAEAGHLGESRLRFMGQRFDQISTLQRIEELVNEVAQSLDRPESYTFSRHAISRNKFSDRAGNFRRHMTHVMDVMERAGLSPMLAYGSLLGAVREGDFIAHDDDVDLLYRSPGNSHSDAAEHRMKVADLMRENGFGVNISQGTHLNFHVISKTEGVSVDLFPFWETDGVAYLHMQKMEIRTLPAEVMLPRSATMLSGQSFPAPGQPERFLEARYGSNWRVPQKFFEWHWALKE